MGDGVAAALRAPLERHTLQCPKEKASGLARITIGTIPALTWPLLLLALALGLNRELVGIFRVDLVSLVFGVMTPAARVVHVLLGVSTIRAAIMALKLYGRGVRQ